MKADFAAKLDAAAAVLNDHGLIEDQWILQGFADGLIGNDRDSDSANDPTYGKYYRKGYDRGWAVEGS